MAEPSKPVITLEFVDEWPRSDAPFYVRARQALKRCLRAYGLRCVRIVGLPSERPERLTDEPASPS